MNGVFAERLAEGQMDECDITMRELQVVAESFRSTLRAVYHPRIEYPDAPVPPGGGDPGGGRGVARQEGGRAAAILRGESTQRPTIED